ncbi:uncharacterized protein LOC126587973 isoform X2 [Malus sylvestris]|uniref:uncharacterized protein LOC126587973 isoform X2 n=1 Tax=Malus sylvestris TaxID=3752 RepID=UPI0021AD4490|nr:uncharacterized protein LOC126587973 isoform X2 [Malus sylvestris]
MVPPIVAAILRWVASAFDAIDFDPLARHSFHLCLASSRLLELKKPSTMQFLGSDSSSSAVQSSFPAPFTFNSQMEPTVPYFKEPMVQQLPSPVENMNFLLPFPGFPTIPKIPSIPPFPFPTMPSVNNPFAPLRPSVLAKISDPVIPTKEATTTP